MIRLGRAIFRDHKVSPEIWAQMEKLFGRQGAVELTMVMADYAMAGFILMRLGRLPLRGESITYEDVQLTVVEMQGPQIKRVEVRKQ